MSGMLDALRTATSALVMAAPEPLVRRMLRELLAEEEESTPASANALSRPGNGAQGDGTDPSPAIAPDWAADWPTLRHQIRAAMAERAIDYEELGALLNYAPKTLQQAISANRPKTRRIMERIKAWLEDPHAVITAAAAEAPAAPPPPFRTRAGGKGGAAARADNRAAAA